MQLLKDKRILITGSEGKLATQWKNAIANEGGSVVGLDISNDANITCPLGMQPGMFIHCLRKNITTTFDGVILAAAYNPPPTVPGSEYDDWTSQMGILRGHNILLDWLISKEKLNANSSIVMIGSDLSITGPDPKLYEDRIMKPAHYTVVKHATLGLMRHYATLLAGRHIRFNCLCPGAINESMPDEEFKNRLINKIPMNELASSDTYNGHIVHLLSEGSKYMTGATIVVDGGRTTI